MESPAPLISWDEFYFRPVSHEHIHAGWLNWMNEKENTAFLASNSQNYSQDDLVNYLINTDSVLFLACYHGPSDSYIGNLRIYKIAPDIYSFGRLIGGKEFKGRGFGSKIARFAIILCFDWFKANMVLVGNHNENKASAASKLRAGFLRADQAQLNLWGIDYSADHSYYYMLSDK